MAWYKEKFPKSRYVRKGDPKWIVESDLPGIEGWVPPTEVELGLWEDAKSVIDQKNKKREYMIEYDRRPVQKPNGMYVLEIKMLHVDYRGFIYSAEAPTVEQLQRSFWPTVEKLIAHYFSPRLVDNFAQFMARQEQENY